VSRQRVVIVGGGQAAGAALRKLRDLQFGGEVVLLSEESHPPYERPPLSKDYLAGAAQDVRLVAPGERANERVHLRSVVVSADPVARTVTCGDGSTIAYDVLLLATGGRPRRLSVPGAELGNVHHLRTAADAASLRRSLQECAHSRAPLLVVGGSWIGLEVAAAARAAGVDVVLLEAGERLCMRTLPPAQARWLERLHRLHGVDVRLHTSLANLGGEGVVGRARLSDGEEMRVGAVVAGIGILPNDALARQCGATVRSGVVVDCHGRTSVPGVYAVGDVTEQECKWHAGPVRIETWHNANAQGEAAAAHIAGAAAPAAAEPPWFWSDQYGRNLQVVGAPLQGDAVLASGGDEDRTLAIHLRGDVVVGGVAVDRPRDMHRLRKLLAGAAPVTPAALRQHGLHASGEAVQ